MPRAERTRRSKIVTRFARLFSGSRPSESQISCGNDEVTVSDENLVRASTSILHENSDDADVKARRRRQVQTESRIRTLRKNRLDNFKKYMHVNFYNHTLHTHCHVCDRIWWSNKLRVLKKDSAVWTYVAKIGYDPSVDTFKVCETCLNELRRVRTPLLATINGFVYPKEANLPALCPISERLISPRLPFMSIRHVRFFEGSKKLYGQVINVPVDVDTMMRVLPRSLHDDYAFNIRIKKNLLNKSSYMAGCVSKSIIKEWLRYLINTPLYKRHNVQIDPLFADRDPEVPDAITDSPQKRVIHQVTRHCTVVPIGEELHQSGEHALSQLQETLFWGEDFILEMAPGQHSKPLALAFDGDAEELSFPSIYYGQPREFKVPVTPYQMATSEIRRIDRRGVRSNHILYMAGRIMRLRIINSFNVMYRSTRNSSVGQITRERLEDADFVRETMNRNESFLSCLPNSVHYWQSRKSDLFAMMRQLGKPTVFLTLSASEIYWIPLLKCVFRYQQHIPDDQQIDDMIFEEMSATQRAQLVNSDPVLCCLYFDRLVDCILKALKLKKGPFGEYRVIEYFRRVEFHHRGSPHCHMLLWLEKDPPAGETKFVDGENVPRTIALIDELCTVDSSLVDSDRKLQTHHHTHTCYKRNTKSCRFGAPFWPMKSTRILLPVLGESRVEAIAERYKSVREMLVAMNTDEDVDFHTIESFWTANGIENEEEYLNILRHGIQRPTIMYKRSMRDTMTSPFNPTISSVLQSNMDIQYIVDEYTCAAYVAEYVNKSERGFSSLHRELIRLRDEYPDMDYEDCMKEVGKRALNSVEMCVQEAAWYLLRIPMSECSRQICFIPTQHPSNRFKCKKTRKQMDHEALESSSTDVWKKNVIVRYEDRSDELKDVTLADFVADYEIVIKKPNLLAGNDNVLREGGERIIGDGEEEDHDDNDEDHDDDDEDHDDDDDVASASHGTTVSYRKRNSRKVIKWVNFDRSSNEMNYKREMVTLFWPFKSEELDLLNNDQYLQIYDMNVDVLRARRAEYESGLRLDDIIEIVHEIGDSAQRAADEDNNPAADVFEDYIRGRGDAGEGLRANDQDIDFIQRDTIVRAVKSAMSHEDFCKMVRSLNYEQRSLLLEFMTRIIYGGDPIQIFFCGPAGAGKTYLLRALMETTNRFAIRRNTAKCAFLACATTGKAAVNVDGTTVHSALIAGLILQCVVWEPCTL